MKRPYLYPAVSLSLGILSSHLFRVPILYLYVLDITCLILAISYLKDRILSHINLYLAIFFLGMLLYQNSDILPADHISSLISEDNKTVFLRGSIVDDPIITTTFHTKERMAFVLNVNSIKEGSFWKRASGLVKVDVYDSVKILGFGDEVILEGLISRPVGFKNPGLFDYSKYLGIKNIYSVLKVKEGFFVETVGADLTNPIKGLAYKLRQKVRRTLDGYLSDPYNGFLKAILIGDRSDLSYSLKEDFIKTGTVHILAISGLHVGLIASIFLSLFGVLRIPKKLNLIFTTSLLVFYSFVAGSSPPILRATIIFSIFVVGYLINREPEALNSLSFAAILLLLWNPKELFDPSFQLSFISIASIVIFAPRIDSMLGLKLAIDSSIPSRMRFRILKSVSISIAAWLGVWPFISSYFNIASPIAIIANIVVIPMLFLLMAIAFLFLFAATFSSFLAFYLAKVLYVTQVILFFMNHGLSELPFAYFRMPSPSIEYSILYYCFLSILVLPKMIRFKNIKIFRKYIFMAVLLFLNILTWKAIINFEGSELKITFLDVGQGDSILVEFPKKGNILIDGGSGGKEEEFDIGRSIIAPYLWNNGINRLDGIIATHFHEDHLGGILYILKNFDVGCVIDNGATPSSDNRLYDEYRRAIKEKRIPSLIVGEGDEIGGFSDIKLFVLNPEKRSDLLDSNDNSIVLKLVYKDSTILFCADIQDSAMERLSASYGGFLKSDILKVPHHGGFHGEEEIAKDFFRKASPKISVISVGREDRFKAPLKKTIDIVTSLNSISYKTKDNGAIRVLIGADYFKALVAEK